MAERHGCVGADEARLRYIHKAFFKGKPDIHFPWDDMSGQSVSREDRDALVLKMKQEEKRYATKKHQG